MERIMQSLRKASGLVVRRAREGEADYFAGVIRAIDTGIQIHADYAPFVSDEQMLDMVPLDDHPCPFSRLVPHSLISASPSAQTKVPLSWNRLILNLQGLLTKGTGR
jgi:hypothetical protein